MTVWLIVFKSLRQHALSTIVTALSVALAGGLLMSVWSIKEQSDATFTGVNAPVTPGTIYMFGITIDGTYAADSAFGAGTQGGDIEADGNSTHYFAWSNESGDSSLLYESWNNTGCANNTGSCGQAEWQVDYNQSAVPEPASLALMGSGMLLLAGLSRRRARR